MDRLKPRAITDHRRRGLYWVQFGSHGCGGGHQVINLDSLTYAGNLHSLSDVAEHREYGFTQVDITDAAAVDEAFGRFAPEAVMHLAAESHVDRSIDGPGQFIQTNVIGTYNLLQASLKHWRTLPAEAAAAFRFLHVSTDEVYGSLGPSGKFQRDHAVRSPFPLLGQQSRQRSPGPRLAGYLWPAGPGDQLQQQLRALTSFPKS